MAWSPLTPRRLWIFAKCSSTPTSSSMSDNLRPPHFTPLRNRREFLMRSCGGLGALALSSMMQAANPVDPLAPKKPDHPPTAKSVIFLFMEGGPSHLDLFDPKPELERMAGKPMPESYGK